MMRLNDAARPPSVAHEDIGNKALLSFLGAVVMPPATAGSSINEPSLAQAGKNVLVSGNWYLARSTDGGVTWSYISPSTDMSDFCCDQEVLYDRGRDLFVWYRQGAFGATGKNRFLISSSADGGQTWCRYSIAPSNLNSMWTKDQAFDFPHLALSNNYIYVHTGMRGAGTPDAAVVRLPLDPLRACTALGSIWWWGQVSHWAAPIQGATNAMYFGDHQGQSNSFRIFRQLEENSGITPFDIPITPWLLEEGATCPIDAAQNCCPSKDGTNWCARSDSHVRAGWLANGVLGFMWNAKQGGGFPFPYIEAALFDVAHDFSYIGRPALWSPNGAWHYPFASPNARGDVAGVAYFSGPSSFPSPQFFMRDDLSSGAAWEAYQLIAGAAGNPGWGDYIRVRPFQPSQVGWVASVYTMLSNGGPQPEFYILVRKRDLPSVSDWWKK
jgi:hypothetical protein